MPTHVALLRGINVGGRNRVAMQELRRLATDLGYSDVSTYIQSGNLLLSTDRQGSEVARELEAGVRSELGVTCAVVVVTRTELADAVAANPFPVTDPKRLHLVFSGAPLNESEAAAVDTAVEKAAAKGSRDRAEVIGAVIYLDTPDGIGRSDLAGEISRKGSKSGTARNWATVVELLRRLGG